MKKSQILVSCRPVCSENHLWRTEMNVPSRLAGFSSMMALWFMPSTVFFQTSSPSPSIGTFNSSRSHYSTNWRFCPIICSMASFSFLANMSKYVFSRCPPRFSRSAKHCRTVINQASNCLSAKIVPSTNLCCVSSAMYPKNSWYRHKEYGFWNILIIFNCSLSLSSPPPHVHSFHHFYHHGVILHIKEDALLLSTTTVIRSCTASTTTCLQNFHYTASSTPFSELHQHCAFFLRFYPELSSTTGNYGQWYPEGWNTATLLLVYRYCMYQADFTLPPFSEPQKLKHLPAIYAADLHSSMSSSTAPPLTPSQSARLILPELRYPKLWSSPLKVKHRRGTPYDLRPVPSFHL